MRNLKFERPICFFDLETTGVDVNNDKIVSISVIKIFHNACHRVSFNSLINPGVPIPTSASEIHGITDDMVKNERSFADLATVIMELFFDSDICGFNSNHFDVPLLSMEFSRVGMSFPAQDAKLVDVGNIFKIKNPRTLAAAYKLYTGKDLEGAHDAKADNEATMEVFFKQLETHDDLPLTVAELADVSAFGNKFADIAQRFLINENGKHVFNFGQHKGKVVSLEFLQYLGWMINKGDFHPSTKDCAQRLYDEILNTHTNKPDSSFKV